MIDFLKESFSRRRKASARKLSAFWIMILITLLHLWWLRHAYIREDFSLLTTILTMDFLFVSTALGMSMYHDIKDLNSKNKNEKTDNSSDNTDDDN